MIQVLPMESTVFGNISGRLLVRSIEIFKQNKLSILV